MAERTVYVDNQPHKGIGYTVRYFDKDALRPLEEVGLSTLLLDDHHVLVMTRRTENPNCSTAPLFISGPFGVVHKCEEVFRRLQDKTKEVVDEMAGRYKTKNIEDRTAENILDKQ